ncbi:hypothetical protein BDV95DRAFT_613239 [Massariosphaeria phaeospora]|uniref:Beta/gamma crystallin 'Greek key' domain-containing protein n=1 Tax=Massariosphaeria phaeospora TaxID=100035 RepID=A0A7C8M1Q4_9PLEO|nr:hypothetical protein BDV95DRAFT_613239 [Massariosphaeria phaeospora]
MKSVIAATVAFLAATVQSSLVFRISTEAGGKGIAKSWVTDRWACHNLADDGLDNQASFAFVDVGLANGCRLYDEADCKGEHSYFVEKNNSGVLGPGAVNLADVNFDDVASSFQCF